MPLPTFNTSGDLPPGLHRATWGEILERFGAQGGQRSACTHRLAHVVRLARQTGFLRRVLVFGSYVTAKQEPNDVDVVLVLDDDFHLAACPLASRGLFDHALAQARYGASVFWVRPAMLIGQTLEQFLGYWQIKRDGGQRGIVDLII